MSEDSKVLGKKWVDEKVLIESTNWNRQQYSKMMKFAGISAVSALVMAIVAVIALTIALSPAEPRYFALDENMQVTPLIPLERPYVSDNAVMNFASSSVTEVLTFSFIGRDAHFQRVKKNFSDRAYSTLTESLVNNGIISSVEDGRLNLNTVLDGVPVITNAQIVNGVATWFLTVPIKIGYESSSGVIRTQNLMARVVIQRVHTLIHPRGIIVEQVVFVPR
ncbi:MAG: DotI/IcmL/TraM family protein [Methyloprofundus sp.]|nr:DotI/IcmL/TraM family protein [Methyloprofundus sp.]